ncbi:hypothetical protein A1F94_006377 [Pyrenophora tritici-repentis]|nr:hypothetical protein A1F94_006377 [Pyrenophora tritici-repentis]
MPVAKEQVGDVPEGLVPAIKLEPPPGFEQDEWEQLTDGFACEADEIDGILDQRGRPINLSVPYTGSLSGSARAIAQRERKALFDKEEKVLESVRTADRSAKYQLKKSLLQQPKYKLANSARQAKLLEKEWDILSEKRFTQKSLDGEPIDEVNDLFELPASLEHTFDIDEENQTTEEESEEEVQEERQLPPRKRQRPQRYRDN